MKDYKQAFEAMLLSGEQESPTHAAMKEFLATGDFDKALNGLTFRNNIEKTLLLGLRPCKTDYLRAIMTLNKTMRNLYLHAFQSFLWNKVVSDRLERFPHKPSELTSPWRHRPQRGNPGGHP